MTRRTVPAVRRMAMVVATAVALMAGTSCSGSGDAVTAATCADAFHRLEDEAAEAPEVAEATVRQIYFSCSRDDWLTEARSYIERNPYPASFEVEFGPEERLRQECDEELELADAPACDV